MLSSLFFGAENFVAANRFTVRPGAEAAFEERWAQRDSGLSKLPGFKSFTMLRRDAKTKGHAEEKGAADKFGEACVIFSGVATHGAFLDATVAKASKAAKALGVKDGMPGRDALALIK